MYFMDFTYRTEQQAIKDQTVHRQARDIALNMFNYFKHEVGKVAPCTVLPSSKNTFADAFAVDCKQNQFHNITPP
jgi:hypothetical protein